MQNTVKCKEMEGCSPHEENTKEPMEERDAYKNRLAVAKTIYCHQVIATHRITTCKRSELNRL